MKPLKVVSPFIIAAILIFAAFHALWLFATQNGVVYK